MIKDMLKHTMILAVIVLLSAPLWGFVSKSGEHNPNADEIRWSHQSKLTWSDFKGAPERGTDKDALTESGISFNWTCDSRGFKAQAYAMFVPSKSWVKTPTTRLLLHEQTHFDITEIHARKIRKYFGEMRNPCWMGKEGINEAARRFLRENRSMQDQYDRETNHSLRDLEQKRWEQKVAAELNALAVWAGQ